MRQETNGAKIQKRLVVLLKMHVPSVDTYMQWDGQSGSLPSIRQLPESRCIYNLCCIPVCQHNHPGLCFHTFSLFASR